MSFDVDRDSSSWAHVALCADLTWAVEPPDDFILANQRLWANHCLLSQVLQDRIEKQNSRNNNQCESTDDKKDSSHNSANGSSGRRSVKDVIPDSKLVQYGNFYYDELREKCYTDCNEQNNLHGTNRPGCENSDLTECWMLPEVEYWFRKLLNESPERGVMPRSRHQFRMVPDEDFGRWGPSWSQASRDEAALAKKVFSVKSLWSTKPRTPSPPPEQRKMRARRRQPKRIHHVPPAPYCLEVPARLFCDPTCKFRFDTPKPPQPIECQRAMSRLTAGVQVALKATARYPPYRGTNISRYAPTQRLTRYPDRRHSRMVWWQKDQISPRLEKPINIQQSNTPKSSPRTETQENKPDSVEENNTNAQVVLTEPDSSEETKQNNTADDQQPSTSATVTNADANLKQRRLYSTVLSMSAPTPINLVQIGCIRLAQKLTPGLIKLNPKTVPRVRPHVENKFEELEKEALEQYKASDESIDTKFRELEKQAVEQYSTSNSNTSCSSGPTETITSKTLTDTKKPAKFHKKKPLDSVVVYSQNFPNLNSKTSSAMNLKNFHGPPRGEKKENKQNKGRSKKVHKASSDTDYEAREVRNHKGTIRWTHMMPPKKRHLTLCVSDVSSDEDMNTKRAIKDAGPRVTHVSGKIKMSAHGGGDLQTVIRKT